MFLTWDTIAKKSPTCPYCSEVNKTVLESKAKKEIKCLQCNNIFICYNGVFSTGYDSFCVEDEDDSNFTLKIIDGFEYNEDKKIDAVFKSISNNASNKSLEYLNFTGGQCESY